MAEPSVFRVGGGTNAISLASVIAHEVYKGNSPTLRAIGPGPVNQAIKAIIIAQSYVGSKGHRISVIPGFADVDMDDGKVTAIVFKLKVE